jgi:hypothetical protein
MSRETGKSKVSDFSNDTAEGNPVRSFEGDRLEIKGQLTGHSLNFKFFEFPLPIPLRSNLPISHSHNREVEKEGLEARDRKIGEVLPEEIKRRGDVRTPYWEWAS